jgi:cob(I)alamin adenosyltransferase
MYNRRISKTHPRIEACGAVDELNSALGLARSANCDESTRAILVAAQKDLINLMGELATLKEDLPRYQADGFSFISNDQIDRLEKPVRELESQKISYKGWATPGANTSAAALDFARSVCRRAERSVCALKEAGDLQNDMVIIFLNRFSDLLWLLARKAEQGSV